MSKDVFFNSGVMKVRTPAYEYAHMASHTMYYLYPLIWPILSHHKYISIHSILGHPPANLLLQNNVAFPVQFLWKSVIAN